MQAQKKLELASVQSNGIQLHIHILPTCIGNINVGSVGLILL